MTANSKGNPWLSGDAPRGDAYDEQLQARSGPNPHGEADFVEELARRLIDNERPSVLDGGCGTGRIAIELARRGFDVAGVDIDPTMLATARRKAPRLPWTQGDLATVQLENAYDLAVLAGNTLIFVGRGHEPAVLGNVAVLLKPRGLLVAGFQLLPNGLSLAEYDRLAAAAGFSLRERWASWHHDPWLATSDYAVSVHSLAGDRSSGRA